MATQMTPKEKIRRLEAFKALVLDLEQPVRGSLRPVDLRSTINQEKGWVRQEVIAARCFKTLTISPPPAVGGLVMRRVDAFAMLFDAPHGIDLAAVVIDMVDETIGALKSPSGVDGAKANELLMEEDTVRGYAFIAMPMSGERQDLDDVLDAIKEAADRCGIQAERVDEPHSTDRITDRMLESIRRAEFVIADLTDGKPNVYFEAGYAHALRKIPIYIARAGTAIEFDLKDYPIIFFRGLRELKDALERKLRGIAEKRRLGR